MGDEKRFPVVEVFGPTIQGEGLDQGISCHFIRLGGCDYACTWCDSPHAVLPHLVRNSTRMTVEEIMDKISRLAPGPEWVILSGGNPCLHSLTGLIDALHKAKFKVAVETQGTRWQDWINECDRVCVSPKPPSSEMLCDTRVLTEFLSKASPTSRSFLRVFLKVVVFDYRDYSFARSIHGLFPGYPFFVSAGNDAGATVGNPSRVDDRTDQEIAEDLITKGRWLANQVMIDRGMSNVKVQMQSHVLFWGNQRGR